MARAGSKTIKDLSTAVLRGFGRHGDDFPGWRARWQAAVGEPMAAHSEPTLYEAGRLTVTADGPAWASRIRQQEAALLRALRRDSVFKALREIKVRIQPTRPAVGTVAMPAPRSTRISSRAARLVRGVAETISDPQLRAALERLGDRGKDNADK